MVVANTSGAKVPQNILEVLPREMFVHEILPKLNSKALRNFSVVSRDCYLLSEVEQQGRVAQWIGVAINNLPKLPEATSWTRLAGGISNMNENKKRNEGDIPSMLIASEYLDPLFEQGMQNYVLAAPAGKEDKYAEGAERMRAMKRRVSTLTVADVLVRISSRQSRLNFMSTWGSGNAARRQREATEAKYQAMVTLDLSDLDLESLPLEIACLRNVMRVILNNNAFKEVPRELFRLPVYELQVEHNLIEKLPEDFHRMSILKRLAVGGNPINYVPTSVKEMALSAIALSYGQWDLFRGMALMTGNTLS